MGDSIWKNDMNRLLTDNIEKLISPVDSIVGNAEMILHEDTNSKIKNSAYEIGVMAKQLNKMVQDMKDIVSISTEGITLTDEEYETDEIILNIRSLLESKTARTGARFSISVDKNIPARLRGDKARLTDTLSKFIENAVRVSGAGRIGFSAECISTMLGEAYLRFIISDSGDGQISDEMNTALVIADAVTQKMKGKLSAKISGRSGSTFTLLMVQNIIGDDILGERVREFEFEKLFEDVDIEAAHISDRCSNGEKEQMREFIKNCPTRIELALHYINDRDYKNYLKTIRGIIQLMESIGARSVADSAIELENAVKCGRIDIARKQTADMSNYILKLVAAVEKIQDCNTSDNISGGIDSQSLKNLVDEINRNLDEYRMENVEELYYELTKLMPEDETVCELLNEGEEHLMNFDVPELKRVLAKVLDMVG